MRCPICGRPTKANDGTLTEALLPREVACQGCADELAGLVVSGKTNEEAFTEAKRRHQARETAAYEASRADTDAQLRALAKQVADAAVAQVASKVQGALQ